MENARQSALTVNFSRKWDLMGKLMKESDPCFVHTSNTNIDAKNAKGLESVLITKEDMTVISVMVVFMEKERNTAGNVVALLSVLVENRRVHAKSVKEVRSAFMKNLSPYARSVKGLGSAFMEN